MMDDMIIVAQAEDYQVDDVVVYQTGHMLVVHRVIERGPDTVTTQGDANNAPDTPVRVEMIKGKVIATLPGAGAVARLLKTPAATITMIGGALLLSELAYRKDKKKDQEELDKIKEEIRRLMEEQE